MKKAKSQSYGGHEERITSYLDKSIAKASTLIVSLVESYQNLVQSYIDVFWGMDKVPQFLPKGISIVTPLSARIQQCAGKQASGIVRGTRKKHEQCLWMIKKLYDEGKPKQARRLEAIIKKKSSSKLTIKTLECDLDERFITIDFNNTTAFDGWVIISSIGQRQKLKIPVKKTKHFNKLNQSGMLLKGIRLSKTKITFNFSLEVPEKNSEGNIIGIDVGHCNVISCSTGFQSQKNHHGHD